MSYKVSHYINNTVGAMLLDPTARYLLGASSGGGGSITLTTTGTSGAATLVGTTLNIPQYTGSVASITTTGTSGAATLIGGVLNIPQYAGSITSVSNADGSLTISPTTGLVVASLNLANANTFTATQAVSTSTANTAGTPTLDIQHSDSQTGTDVLISRFIGISPASGGIHRCYIKIGNSNVNGSGAFWDIVNDGSSMLTMRYSNFLSSIGSSNAFGINYQGNLSILGTASIPGSIGLGVTVPTSTWINIAASSTAKSHINLTPGVAPTSPVNGDIWFDGTHIHGQISATTYQLDQQDLANFKTAQTSNYTAILADRNTIVPMNLAGANTFTIPLNSSVAFPIGSTIIVQQLGAGACTITPTGGVTLQGISLVTSAQYAVLTLIKSATDTWMVI